MMGNKFFSSKLTLFYPVKLHGAFLRCVPFLFQFCLLYIVLSSYLENFGISLHNLAQCPKNRICNNNLLKRH